MIVDAIVLDADDTLWHNEPFYQVTLSRVRELVSVHVDPAGLDRGLRELEGRNLRIYGYGVKSFVLTVIEAAIEAGGPGLPTSVIAEILAAGREMMQHPVSLLPEVRETLAALAAHHPLYLLTKGDLFHQEAKIAAAEIGTFFAGTQIVSDKTPDTYRRVFRHFGLEPANVLVAGNSMRSDVLPALEVGAFAALIPYELVWAHEHAEEPVANERFFKLQRISELPQLLRRLNR